MNHESTYGYGLWWLAIINSIICIIFAFSFTQPKTKRDWRTFGSFSAFLIAMFTEMYGFPFTIYLLSGWLGTKFPGIDFLSHDAGHLLEMMFGWQANPHFGPFHILSNLLIFAGFVLLSYAWPPLHKAQARGELATTGVYARIRHPQYVAFILIMFGFLLQWPTLLTIAMFPILTIVYIRLAKREEREALAEFGDEYRRYMQRTPAFIPSLRRHAPYGA